MKHAQKHEECVAFKNEQKKKKKKKKKAKYYAILTSLKKVTSMHVTFDDVVFVMSQKLHIKIKMIKRTSM